MLCKCGHEKSEHYRYCNNGKDTPRCRKCDPNDWKNMAAVSVVITGSRHDQLDKAADHEFVESVASLN